jgi:hypothetical protein
MSTHSESNNFNPDVNKIEVEAVTRSVGGEHSQEKVDSPMPVNSSVSKTESSEPNKSEPIQIGRWWQAWQVWGLLLVFISGGIGFSATSMLLRLPKTQNCDRVFWPTASASIRLYCAQTSSQDKTVKGLLKAIDLVAVLPDNHPLRPEIDRNIERWAEKILEIGETQFQEGKLEEAIGIAESVPEKVAARSVVDEKVARWRKIWAEGEETYSQVEEQLRKADWNAAFSWAVRLTESKNQYWATTKYQESINNINIAQEETASLEKAETQLTSGSIDNLLLAIEKADKIPETSYAYERAQKIAKEAKEQLVAYVEESIESEDWQQVQQVTSRLPASLKLQDRVSEWNILANAGTSADLDTVFGLEDAISEASRLDKKSIYYDKAQKLISNWKLEIGAVRHLSQAREFARGGDIANYQAAIAEAEKVDSSNPRYQDARREIASWQSEIQIIQDRPILDRARELAVNNNVEAWNRAIAEANLISPNSPLYREAQQSAATWRANIERIEDQPILDRALSLANNGNYAAAITTAQQIRSGRALSSEAGDKISLWQKEIQAERYLKEAYALEAQGTPEALSKAIRVIRQISRSSSKYGSVVSNVNLWGDRILVIAQQASTTSLERAIAIAELVPEGTISYGEARTQIKNWKELLSPPEPETIDLPSGFKLDKNKDDRE